MTPRAPGQDALAPAPAEAMRARHHPAAIAMLWAWETAFALVVAWPIASAVGAVYGAHPDGDAPLWQPGGLDLANLFFTSEALQSSAFTLFALTLALSAVADLVPLAALLTSLSHVTRARTAPPLGAAVVRGGRALPTLAGLLAGASVVQGVVLVIALAAARATSRGLMDRIGKPHADELALLVVVAFAVLAAFTSVARDLARAAAIRFGLATGCALRLAMTTVARGPFAALWSWGWRAVAGVVPVVIGAIVADRLGGRGGAALFALFVVHQLALLARVALRASWLAEALRAIDRARAT